MMFRFGGGGGHGNGWGRAVMFVATFVFWTLVIAGVALLLHRPDRAPGGMVPGHRSAQQVLAERSARGAIDENDFSRRMSALHGTTKL